MKIVFLAAGFSTRLYPLTENFPKGLLKINNQPIIARLLDQAKALDASNQIALVTNQRCFASYKEYLESQPELAHIKIISNQVDDPDQRLGAIGDLILVLDQLGWHGQDLLVLPSDTLVGISLQDYLLFSNQHQAISNVVYDIKDPQKIAGQLGCVELKGEQIIGFEEKPKQPKSSLTSVPIYFYPANTTHLLTEYAQTGQNMDSPGAIIPWLLEQTTVYGYQISSYYYDVGTHAMLAQLQADPAQFLPDEAA